MKKIAVLTSGGDSPGMNAAIRAVVRKSLFLGAEVYGVYNGYTGLIDGNVKQLYAGTVGDILHRGGTMLRTSRSEEFKTEEGRLAAIHTLISYGIEGLVVIGGDGSCRGAKTLYEKGISVAVIPGTIDNDFPATELTLGFDTAVNTALEAVDKIRDTASSHDRVYVIEVMGRNSGNLAIWAGLAGGAESIVIPEKELDITAITDRLLAAYRREKRYSIVIAAEGVASTAAIAEAIKEKTGFDTRITILGHIQRGGAPSARDRILGSLWGAQAAEILCESETEQVGAVLGIQQNQIISNDFAVLDNKISNIDPNLYQVNDTISI